MKQADILNPVFDAIDTLCTVSANQPSLPESSNIIINSEMINDKGNNIVSLLNCVQCSREFKTAAQLRNHLASRHYNIRPFKCLLCMASFTLVAHLKAHMRIHSGERPYQCQQCSSSFIQLSHLKTHQKLHTGEKPFICDICDSRFRQQSNLKSHRLIHTGERPYKCDTCNSSFVQVGHLKSHKRIHTNERPYQCKECPAAFRQISNLRNHENTHYRKKQLHLKLVGDCKLIKNDQSKPCKTTFACTQCDFKSHKRDFVLTHFRSFHGDLLANKQSYNNSDAIFMCSVCEACFASCESVKLHMKLHAERNLYTCPTCKESFLNIAEMLSHKETHSNSTESIHLGTDFENNHKLHAITESSLEPVITNFGTHVSCQVLFIDGEKADQEKK